ncbi:hypothetical protein JOB18_035248 [Solea senegalensis]|uniref:Uncharacterized protein n=1 Tax=Solea senegalensis TaxID=28829 RepID=A0AAV6SMH5_SOLSE|nr:hypothetical protein JOB18_035248 [Solea senegalensis]
MRSGAARRCLQVLLYSAELYTQDVPSVSADDAFRALRTETVKTAQVVSKCPPEDETAVQRPAHMLTLMKKYQEKKKTKKKRAVGAVIISEPPKLSGTAAKLGFFSKHRVYHDTSTETSVMLTRATVETVNVSYSASIRPCDEDLT